MNKESARPESEQDPEWREQLSKRYAEEAVDCFRRIVDEDETGAARYSSWLDTPSSENGVLLFMGVDPVAAADVLQQIYQKVGLDEQRAKARPTTEDINSRSIAYELPIIAGVRLKEERELIDPGDPDHGGTIFRLWGKKI